MLSFDGNTAPYLQYAHARIQSIFRRGDILPNPDGTPLLISEPAEHALAIELLRFQEIILGVAETMEFHHLANYLYDLSNAFTAFYERCTVLKSEEPIRTSRLNICSLTARVLSTGLKLLGIIAPERM
jgi:arginyl-tRNA synthetase